MWVGLLHGSLDVCVPGSVTLLSLSVALQRPVIVPLDLPAFLKILTTQRRTLALPGQSWGILSLEHYFSAELVCPQFLVLSAFLFEHRGPDLRVCLSFACKSCSVSGSSTSLVPPFWASCHHPNSAILLPSLCLPCWNGERSFFYVAQASLELLVLLPPLPSPGVSGVLHQTQKLHSEIRVQQKFIIPPTHYKC